MFREIKLANKPVHSGQLAKILQRKFVWVLLVSLSVFLTASVLTAPAIGFFLNHEQKQCNFGISGDEHGDRIPPYPWQKAEPDSSGIIQTKYGSCNLNEFNNNRLSPQDCCKQLGYTYVDKISGD